MKYATFCGMVLSIAALLFSNGLRAEEPKSETRVVYPASATSRNPIVVGPAGSAVSPVREEGELDVETPLGNIRAIRDSLDSIQARLTETNFALVELAERPDRTDEILNALERNNDEQDVKDRAAEEESGGEDVGSNEARTDVGVSQGVCVLILLILGLWLPLSILAFLSAKAVTTARELAEELRGARQRASSDGNSI